MTKPIFLVGEAQGEAEAKLGKGFVGQSGRLLLEMLSEAEVIDLSPRDRESIARWWRSANPLELDSVWSRHPEVYRTNVFQRHPPGNKLEFFCGTKGQGLPDYGPLLPSKYVRAEFGAELDRLGDEILAHDPNLIICLGNSAVWALTGKTGVGKLRGTTIPSTHCVSGYKLLVAYHPAAVLRQHDLRPVTIIDLAKAVRESASPDIQRPPCEIWIEPDLDDVKAFFSTYLPSGYPEPVAVDIETVGTRITCIGFAPRRDLAIVIPFDDSRKPGRSYWPTPQLERQCWELIRAVLGDASIKKVFQNGLYDIAFLFRSYGIATQGASHDTMLLHHALQPEALKGLGFLGSVYTDHGPWKVERKGTHTIKRDE